MREKNATNPQNQLEHRARHRRIQLTMAWSEQDRCHELELCQEVNRPWLLAPTKAIKGEGLGKDEGANQESRWVTLSTTNLLRGRDGRGWGTREDTFEEKMEGVWAWLSVS
jgi:hypothetical protein